jgi:predicted DNA-binding protein
VKTLELFLPKELHERIRRIAKREAKPTQEILRSAISAGLAIRERKQRARAIKAYARRMAGSPQDLDADLESATIDCLQSSVDDRE